LIRSPSRPEMIGSMTCSANRHPYQSINLNG
jgi:hypothetical protein